MKILYLITNSKYPNYSMFVETLTDFMFQEGWRTDREVPYKQHEHDWQLRESDEYFSDLQYGDV